MCWIGRYIPRRTTEDFECFKVLYTNEQGTLFSYYQKMIYELNYRYDTKICFEHHKYHNWVIINQGFHSYNNKCNIEHDYNLGLLFIRSMDRGVSLEAYGKNLQKKL
jgi:hypothetical protein